MRSHVFPVCRPSFESVEVDVNELSEIPTQYLSTFYSNESGSQVFFYRSGVLDEFQFNVVAEKLVSEILFSESVASLTEVLELVKGDSVGDTTFGLANYYFLYSYAGVSKLLDLYVSSPNSQQYKQEEDTPPGFVVCVGIKNAKDIRDKVKETDSNRGATIATRSYPNNGIISSYGPFTNDFVAAPDEVDTLVNNMFATFMYTGTRWVLLGSNNWIS
jgi:hypothetical protein